MHGISWVRVFIVLFRRGVGGEQWAQVGTRTHSCAQMRRALSYRRSVMSVRKVAIDILFHLFLYTSADRLLVLRVCQ